MRLPEHPIRLLVLLAIALALAAGHAAGSDPDAGGVQVAEPVARDHAAPGAQRAQPEMTLALSRPRRAPGEDAVTDVFSGRSWIPAPPPAPPVAPAPPPEPTAPALPFAYVGRLEADDAKPIVYLSRGERLLAVSEGDVVDKDYRIESLTNNEIVLVYLPLGKQQTLRIGSERK